MHAPLIEIAKTIAPPLPQQSNLAARSAVAPESFGLAMQREASASAGESAAQQKVNQAAMGAAAERGASGETVVAAAKGEAVVAPKITVAVAGVPVAAVQGAEIVAPKIAVQARVSQEPEATPAVAGKTAAESAALSSVVSAALSASVGGAPVVAQRVAVEARGSAGLGLDSATAVLNSKTKRESKVAAAAVHAAGDGPQVVKPEVAAVAVVPMNAAVVAAVPVNAAVIAIPVVAPVVAAVAGVPVAKVAAVGAKRERPAMVVGAEKSLVGKSAPAPGDGAVAAVEKDGKAAVAAAGTQAAAGEVSNAVAALGHAAAASGHAVVEIGPGVAAGVHGSAVEAAVGAQTLAPVTAQGLAVGAELRLNAANAAEQIGPAGGGAGHQVLMAGPTQLEVGVFDGTHGWVQIRTELGAGGAVSATLTGSAAAHEALRAAVPEMASYLSGEQVNVGKIAVHRAAETPGAMTAGQQSGESQGQRGSGQAPRGSGAGRAGGVEDGASGVGSGAAGELAVKDWAGGLPAAGLGYAGSGSGSWLNVRV